jgi:hypothetical protein
MISHEGCTQMSFCLGTPKLGVPKFLKLGFLELWKPITSYKYLWLRWNIKQSCSHHWNFFNNMWHVTCTQVNQGDSWRLVVGSQIRILTPGPSFGHNLCFKYSNESCEPILDIYALRDFQWCKELFNLMNFGSWNCFIKIQDFVGILTPKVGVHLGMCGFIPSHSFTFQECKFNSWVALLVCTFPCPCLVISLNLGSWHG